MSYNILIDKNKSGSESTESSDKTVLHLKARNTVAYRSASKSSELVMLSPKSVKAPKRAASSRTTWRFLAYFFWMRRSTSSPFKRTHERVKTRGNLFKNQRVRRSRQLTSSSCVVESVSTSLITSFISVRSLDRASETARRSRCNRSVWDNRDSIRAFWNKKHVFFKLTEWKNTLELMSSSCSRRFRQTTVQKLQFSPQFCKTCDLDSKCGCSEYRSSSK